MYEHCPSCLPSPLHLNLYKQLLVPFNLDGFAQRDILLALLSYATLQFWGTKTRIICMVCLKAKSSV